MRAQTLVNIGNIPNIPQKTPYSSILLNSALFILHHRLGLAAAAFAIAVHVQSTFPSVSKKIKPQKIQNTTPRNDKRPAGAYELPKAQDFFPAVSSETPLHSCCSLSRSIIDSAYYDWIYECENMALGMNCFFMLMPIHLEDPWKLFRDEFYEMWAKSDIDTFKLFETLWSNLEHISQ